VRHILPETFFSDTLHQVGEKSQEIRFELISLLCDQREVAFAVVFASGALRESGINASKGIYHTVHMGVA
jgi:hypothetical protein